MKVINKTCECVTLTSPEGRTRPLRIRLEENDEQQVVVIDRVLKIEDIMNGKDKTIKYYCEVVVNERNQVIELLYDLKNTKWILYRI